MRADNSARFERLLAALARELAEATDEEVLQAANDLGMRPMMKGSAAFFGITVVPRAPFMPGESRESAHTPPARNKLKDDPPN